MNNNIQESYCSFEVSKLLKEKGFDCKCNHKVSFTDKNEFYVAKITYTKLSDCDKLYRDGNILVPTHALAIEWIRVNFNINIHLSAIGDEETLLKDCKWSVSVYQNKVYNFMFGSKVTPNIDYFNSPQEATEAALLYTLKELIK